MDKETVHNKLARDKIPEILASKNVRFRLRVLKDSEYDLALKQKLREEIEELINTQDDEHLLEEMADVLEVIHAILAHKNKSFETLEKLRCKKVSSRGGFFKRIFLEKTIE